MITIYALKDPRDEATVYVGRTKNPKQRLAAHMALRGTVGRELAAWIAALKRTGLAPAMVELAKCNDADAKRAETAWIGTLRSAGAQLLNKAEFVEEEERRTYRLVVSLTLAEHESIKAKAGARGIAMFVRDALGLDTTGPNLYPRQLKEPGSDAADQSSSAAR